MTPRLEEKRAIAERARDAAAPAGVLALALALWEAIVWLRGISALCAPQPERHRVPS